MSYISCSNAVYNEVLQLHFLGENRFSFQFQWSNVPGGVLLQWRWQVGSLGPADSVVNGRRKRRGLKSMSGRKKGSNITMAGPWAITQVSSTHNCMVQCTHLLQQVGHPTCIIEGLACWLTLCILEKIICNFTNSVQISSIQTLKLIVFSWTIWWC